MGIKVFKCFLLIELLVKSDNNKQFFLITSITTEYWQF